jgi:hypothetical protein
VEVALFNKTNSEFYYSGEAVNAKLEDRARNPPMMPFGADEKLYNSVTASA